jgi:hypothetical protein
MDVEIRFRDFTATVLRGQEHHRKDVTYYQKSLTYIGLPDFQA